jgi:2-polyprenyl-3-methyl-5-hydroxy-6-metoxy-1,4-benzoquinol methylase
MIDKESIITTYVELFTRGEMLKGANFINNCVPLELEEDEDIIKLREECNRRIEELSGWWIGRPYSGEYSDVAFDIFPKFVLAKEKIEKQFPFAGNILDIGCYSGVFIREMVKAGYACTGIDIHKKLMEILEAKNMDKVNLRFEFGLTDDLRFPDKYFDVVTAFDVLEHVFDIGTTIFEMERVCKPGGLIIINLPRMEEDYKDEAFEHLRMFSDNQIQKMWGKKNNYTFELCQDELGRDTSFITYTK